MLAVLPEGWSLGRGKDVSLPSILTHCAAHHSFLKWKLIPIGAGRENRHTSTRACCSPYQARLKPLGGTAVNKIEY